MLPTVHQVYDQATIDRFYAAGTWTDATLGATLDEQASRDPGRVLLDDDTQSLTLGDLARAARDLAGALAASGIGRGDRISVQIPNWTEFAVVVTAAGYLGAVVVPIMPIYRRDEVGHILADAGVRASFTAGTVKGFDYVAMYRDLRTASPDLELIVTVRTPDTPPDCVAWDDLVDNGPSLTDDAGDPDAPWIIVYSSGTTSRPKGCVHSLNTLRAAARLLGDAVGYTATDISFGPAPITHTQGLVNAILVPLLLGGSSRVMDPWDPGAALDLIDRERCTVAMSPPAMLEMMLSHAAADSADLSSIRVWTVSGSAVPPVLMERAAALMPRAHLLSAYGRTENLTTTMCTPSDAPGRSLDSDGRALAGLEVRVVDDAGLELARGAEGDIAFRGPTHMLGYLNQPDVTAAMFTPDGFSRSGDLGVMDSDGYVRVTGRTKDIVIRGGMNISVRQVEDLIAAWPGVQGVAVVGMPDARLGERLCCFIALAPGARLTLDEVKDYLLAQGLAIQKVPEHLELLDQLPVNALGKIQKNDLREQARRIGTT